jgi:hypothetical protein
MTTARRGGKSSTKEASMRTRRLWTGLALVLALSLAGCAGDREAEGGGGGDGDWTPTHDRSNPTSREQATNDGALPLQAQPQGNQATFGEGIEGATSVEVAEGGRALVKVDVNSATVPQLMEVPGMSHNLARAIVNNRPYKDAADLSARIPNLDPRLVKAYEPHLTFGPVRDTR